MMTTYIHYGSDHFYPDFFTPSRNGDWRPKPAVGTGLWASRVDDDFGWEFWCRENHFNLERLQTFFRFQLPGALILTLEDPDQLIRLPKLHPWEPKKPMEVKHPTLEQLRNGMYRTGATWTSRSWRRNMTLLNSGTAELLPILCPHGTVTASWFCGRGW